MLIFRDILMFLFAYLGIKRAGCVCKVQPDKFFYDPMEKRLEVDIYGGKDTKKKGKRFFIAVEQPTIDLLSIFKAYKGFILDLYARGQLTEDGYGKKFFVTCTPKTLEWNDTRMSTPIYIRVLRDRMKEYFNETNTTFSEEEINNILKKYASHSMRRGGASAAKKKWSNIRRGHGTWGWDREKTKNHYVDNSIAGVQAYKK